LEVFFTKTDLHYYEYISNKCNVLGKVESEEKRNKTAHRALGRLPVEKVKGHSGAIYRGPQGHNLNNFGRRPIVDAIYQIRKLWPCSFRQEDFLKVSFKKPMY